MANIEEARAVYEDIRKEGAQRGWWATYQLPPWLQTYVGMEAEATSIRVFEIELVTALLQTKAYATRTQEVGGQMLSAESIRRLTDARLRRQVVLDGPEAPKVSAIICESALSRTAQEKGVGVEQLRYLIAASKKPNIDIRVLPTGAGMHASMSGSFHLLAFDPEVSVPVAYQEYAVGGHLIDDSAVVETLAGVFERLSRQTLSKRESVELIGRYATETEERDNGTDHQ